MMTLKQWRQRRGVSAAELAKMADVSNKTISDIETGKVNPQFGTMRAICAALDVKHEDVTEFRLRREDRRRDG